MTPRRLSIALGCGLLLAGSACQDPTAPLPTEEWLVLGSRVTCYGFAGPEDCFGIVRVAANDTTAVADSDVRGFTFEPGLRQRIMVSIEMIPNPPQDGSDRIYRLVRVISREPRPTPP
jgi:hypothetical protein